MIRHVTLVIVATVIGATAAFSNAEEATRKSEIATFESVQQNKDYRVSLLSVSKGIAFLDSQELINDGGRTPGKNAVPWVRVTVAIENLTDQDETWGYKAETADGKELVGKIMCERNGHITTSRTSGLAEMDCDYPRLRDATFPVGLPAEIDTKNSKIHAITLSGKLQPSETVVLRFSFGDANNRRELVFKDVPLP